LVGAKARAAEQGPKRHRGRPLKTAETMQEKDSPIVEWWIPGWKEKYR
jgi:hypothetical protein